MPRKIMFFTLLLTLCGCATISVDQLKQITVGMTKKEVGNLLGGPEISATIDAAGKSGKEKDTQGKGECFKYLLPEKGKSFWQRKPYFVRFSDGRVAAFGKMSDIDSPDAMAKLTAAEPEPVLAGEAAVGKAEQPDIPAKLRELKQLADDGIITREDFARQKKKLLDSYTRENSAGDGFSVNEQ